MFKVSMCSLSYGTTPYYVKNLFRQKGKAFWWKCQVRSTEQGVQVSGSGFFPLTVSPVAQHSKDLIHMKRVVCYNLLQLHRRNVQSQYSNLSPRPSHSPSQSH